MKTEGDKLIIESGDAVSFTSIPFEATETLDGMDFSTIQLRNVLTINGEEFECAGEMVRRVGPIVQIGEQPEWRIVHGSVEVPE